MNRFSKKSLLTQCRFIPGALALLLLFLTAWTASAATFYWDADNNGANSTFGGTGSWTTAAPNLWDQDSNNANSNNTTWVNGATNVADFRGTAGTVTLATAITLDDILFNTTGYTIAGTGSNTLTFASGATPTVSIASGVAATITAPIAGTGGLRVSGVSSATSSLSLGLATGAQATTLTGGINIINATLSADVSQTSNRLGTTNTINLQSGSVLNLTPHATKLAGISGRVFAVDVGGNTAGKDFTLPATSTRIDTELNYPNLLTAPVGNLLTPSTSVTVQWVGQINITTGGTYQFGTASDDGSRLWIDGVLVVNNDGGKGVADSFNTMTVSAGLHDVRIDYTNGTGGSGEIFSYGAAFVGADQAYAPVPPSRLFQAETNTLATSSTAINLGNNLNVTGNSTINLTGSDFTQLQFGTFAIATGTTLNVTGASAVGKTLRVGASTLGGAVGTVTLNTDANIAFDGVVTEGAAGMNIVKQGLGRLIFDQITVANTLTATTTLDIQNGSLVLLGSRPSLGAAPFNPIGAAKIKLSGVDTNLILEARVNNNSTPLQFDNAVEVTANATIQTINNTTNTILGGTTNGISITTASTLTLDAIAGGNPVGSTGATLTIQGPVTGVLGSVISFKSTQLGSFSGAAAGVFNLRGDFATGYNGDFRFTGTKEVTVFGDVSNNLDLKGGRAYTITVDTGSSGKINAHIGQSGGVVGITKTGNGTLTLNNTSSDYTGVTTINGGILKVISMSNAGSPSSIGAALGTASNIVLDGGTLSYIGTPSVDPSQLASSRRSFTLGLGATAGTISADGVGVGSEFKFGVLGGTQTVAFLGSGARTLTLGGANKLNNVFGAILGDENVSTGKTSLVKTGVGTWIMVEAASTFTGGTTVSAGILSVAANGAVGTGNVNVSSAATLELRGVDYTSTAPTLILQNTATVTAVVNSGNIGNTLAATDSSWAGGLNLAGTSSNISVASGVNLTFSGIVSGTGAIVQLGSGTVIFSGTLSGRDASSAATYTTQSGTLVLDYTTNSNSKLGDAASLTLGGSRLGGTVQLKNGSHVEVVSGVTLNSGENMITRNGGTSVLRMNTITRNTGATIQFSADDIASTDNLNVNGILGAWATVGLNGWASNSLVQDAGGTHPGNSTDGLIRALATYSLTSAFPDWGATRNMTVDGDVNNTPIAGSQAYTLRFFDQAADLEQTITLASGTSYKIISGGILVAANMGTTSAVITGSGSLAGPASANDLVIIQNNTQAPFEISAAIVNNGVNVNGVDKTGAGNLILSGNNTYTGVTTLNNGVTTVRSIGNIGVASGLGASNVSATEYDRLVFNGGTLQLNALAGVMSTNRGFTVAENAIWDIGNESTTLSITGQYATPTATAGYTSTKIGSGTLELVKTTTALASGYGLTGWNVSDGTVRLSAGVDNQYARSDAALTMSGGTLEFVGTGAAASTRIQNMSGALTLAEGASVIRVKSAANVTSILTLQDTTAPTPITNQKGSTLLISEDNSSGGSSIVRIAGEVGIDVLKILPRVVYQTSIDVTNPGVNYFAVIDSTAYDVGASDNIAIGGIPSHDLIANVSSWTITDNVSDGALSSGVYTGTIASNAWVNTIRFFNNSGNPSVVTIDPAATLTLQSGAILQTTHSGNVTKSISGGNLTSNLYNYDADSIATSVDLIVHNWDPLAPLTISSTIINNVESGVALNFVQSGNGTTALSGANTYTGTTYVQGGVLRLDSANALPGGIGVAGGTSHLRLDGGVIGLNSGNFSRGLGTGATQIDWTSSGGFAAYTVDRTVNLGNAAATVVWGSGSFVPDNDTFILGAYDADKTVVFQNGIDLGRNLRMIRAVDGSADVDGRLSGVISGTGGTLIKAGQGGLELTSANTYAGGTYLAQGLLIGTNNTSFGTGANSFIRIGATAATRSVDALELRFTGTTLANAITVGNASLGNTESISTIRTTNAAVAVTGTVDLQKQTFIAPASGSVASYSNITGTKGFTLIDGGTLTLANANTYGSASGGAGTAVNGSTVIRNGTIQIGNSASLGNAAAAVELGDATFVKTAVDYATNRSVLGVENNYQTNANGVEAVGGVFVADGNGSRDGAGVAQGGGTGAFLNVNKTLNGHTFVVGEKILVKDEAEYPERNGIYQVVSVTALDETGAATTTMNLVRVAEFDNLVTLEMFYGAQVTVNNGGTAGNAGTYFMASPNIVTASSSADPSQWLRDVSNPNVSLYATAASLTIANPLDVNANGSGTTTVGTLSDLAGVVFSGNVTLQDLQNTVAESKTLTLASASLANPGILFSGVFSETTGTGGSPDVLSLIKSGNGVVTLNNTNTYHGTTSVQTGTLRITNSSALGAADGTAGTSTTVSSLATLEIDGTSANLNVGNEALTLSGTGVSSAGAVFVRGGNDNIWGGVVTLAANTTVNVNTSAKLSFTNTVQQSSASALTKTGLGTLALSGANTYAGDTNITAGTLLVNNTTGSGTGTGAVTVTGVGTTVGGNGFIVAGAGKAVNFGSGTILTIGTQGSLAAEDLNITTSGSGVITLSGELKFDLYTTNQAAGLNPTTANDRLLLSGPSATVLSSGSSVLTVNSNFAVNSTNFAVGSIWDLIDWTTIATGSFQNIATTKGNYLAGLDLSGFGREWDFTNLYTTGQISVVAIVPEPGRFSLLTIALACLILRRKRKS